MTNYAGYKLLFHCHQRVEWIRDIRHGTNQTTDDIIASFLTEKPTIKHLLSLSSTPIKQKQPFSMLTKKIYFFSRIIQIKDKQSFHIICCYDFLCFIRQVFHLFLKYNKNVNYRNRLHVYKSGVKWHEKHEIWLYFRTPQLLQYKQFLCFFYCVDLQKQLAPFLLILLTEVILTICLYCV